MALNLLILGQGLPRIHSSLCLCPSVELLFSSLGSYVFLVRFIPGYFSFWCDGQRDLFFYYLSC